VSTKIHLLRYAGALLFVIVTGILAWWIGSKVKSPEENHNEDDENAARKWAIQILGWTSAVLYVSIVCHKDHRVFVAELQPSWDPGYLKYVC